MRDSDAFRLVERLCGAKVEFCVVGGLAAVLLGAPVMTRDLDIVHRRTGDNVDRLARLLEDLRATYRFDLADRKLPIKREALLGRGHLNLTTDLGPFDVLCELAEGEGFEQILPDTELLDIDGLEVRVLGLSRLIQVKAAAGRPKDRLVLPILIATLEERRAGKG